PPPVPSQMAENRRTEISSYPWHKLATKAQAPPQRRKTVRPLPFLGRFEWINERTKHPESLVFG
ncbi:MAG: hypothetical protein L7W43_18320, partial [Rubripirellula sp.]|nr:hypothetical protein [Rubripirellula sp.]